MPDTVRVEYQEELESLEASALGGLDLVSSALAKTLEAVEHQDVELAQLVIADDDRIDGRYLEIHQSLITLLATQSPVATDLRLIASLLHVLKNIERMGDLARHVAKIARLRYPDSALPPALRSHFVEMGQIAERIVTQVGSVIASKNTADAQQAEAEDERMDELHRDLFTAVHEMADLPTTTVVDLTLLGRYYERYADHAVSVARRVVFLVTGSYDAVPDRED